jgi:RNA methyltransferase, TrmH family
LSHNPEGRITSRQNPWFRRFLEAARSHDQELLLEGPKQIADAMRAGWVPIAWALEEDIPSPDPDVKAVHLSRSLIRELTDAHHPQGVLALFRRPESDLAALFASANPLLVILDGIQDPGNVGTILRLATAFDATGVVSTEGTADPFSPKALRASAGAALLVPVVGARTAELVPLLAAHTIPLFAADTEGAEIAIRRPAAIAFGNEGRGISAEMRAHARTVGIRMSSRIDSLNVGAAAAILLHRIFTESGKSR